MYSIGHVGSTTGKASESAGDSDLRANLLQLSPRHPFFSHLAVRALNVPLTESNVLFIEQLLQHVYACGCDHGALMESLRAQETDA